MTEYLERSETLCAAYVPVLISTAYSCLFNNPCRSKYSVCSALWVAISVGKRTFRRRHVSPESRHGSSSSDSTPGLTRRNGVFRYVHMAHPAKYASCKSLQGVSRVCPLNDDRG